mgnify:CR=1 FL=1
MGFYHTGGPFPAQYGACHCRYFTPKWAEETDGRRFPPGDPKPKTVDVPGLPLPDTLSIWSTSLIPKNFFSWQSAVDCCVSGLKNIIQKLSTFNCYAARISLHLRLPFRLL